MQLGMIGLGRMGANIVRRLMRDGHTCVVYDVSPKAVTQLAAEGATGSSSLDDFVARLDTPRHAWVMVPAGEITESTVRELGSRLEPGDVVVDGGNSYYRDDIRRAAELAERGVRYLDCGTSGGVFGLERGFCLMVGGPAEAFAELEPIFASLAPGVDGATRTPGREGEPSRRRKGYLYCGPPGAGHFVKMVHNGIEYGMMAALAEGLNILHAADVGLRRATRTPRRRRSTIRRTTRTSSTSRRSRSCGGAAASSSRGCSTSPLRRCRSRRRWTVCRAGLGLRRGTLDGHRGDRGGRAGGRPHRGAVSRVLLARRGPVREQGAVGDAKPVRRAPREAGVVGAATCPPVRETLSRRTRPARRRPAPRGQHRDRPDRRAPPALRQRSGRRPSCPRRCS